jgi:hypothetical protein
MAVLNCGHSTIVGLCASCAAEVRNADMVKPQGFYPVREQSAKLEDVRRLLNILAAAEVCEEQGFLEVAAQLRRIAAR